MCYEKEPREFRCFDDHDNDGWNNSTIEPRYREEPEPEETEPDFDDISESGTITIANRGNFACTIDGSATFNPHLNDDSTIGREG